MVRLVVCRLQHYQKVKQKEHLKVTRCGTEGLMAVDSERSLYGGRRYCWLWRFSMSFGDKATVFDGSGSSLQQACVKA